MPQRMLSYQIRIWDRYRKQHPRGRLPLVVAVLVCHVPGGWTAPCAFEELVDPAVLARPAVARLVPRCAMITLDLAHRSSAELQALALPPFQRLALWLLRDARDPARLLAEFDTWRPLLVETGRARSDAFAVLIEYLLQVVRPVYWAELDAKLRSLGASNEEATMTIAEMLERRGRAKGRAEGRAKGRAEGRAEGLAEGRSATLRSLLVFKFQTLDAAAEARLRTASPEAIDRYLRRLLTADSLAAVFEDGARPRAGTPRRSRRSGGRQSRRPHRRRRATRAGRRARRQSRQARSMRST